MTACTVKKPSGFMHAAARTGLRVAFAAYDFASKHPHMALCYAGGIAVAGVAGPLWALPAVVGGGLFLGVMGGIVQRRALARGVFSSSEEEAAGAVRYVEAYQRAHRKENEGIKSLLDEGSYKEAVHAKIHQRYPARSGFSLVKEYYSDLSL